MAAILFRQKEINVLSSIMGIIMEKQTRREFLKAVGFAAASAGAMSILQGCAGTGRVEGAKGKRPNILFLFTDDQRFDTIRAGEQADHHA